MTAPKLRYLFAGWPAGGTKYLADLLTKNGIPCVHERITFGVRFDKSDVVSWSDAVANSNHLLAYQEIVNCSELRSLRVIQFVRDPLKTFSSYYWLCSKAEGGSSVDFVLRDLLVRYFSIQKTMYDRRKMYIPGLFRVEDAVPFVKDFFELETVCDVPHTTNSHGRNERRSWTWDELLKYPDGPMLHQIAKTYGYLV